MATEYISADEQHGHDLVNRAHLLTKFRHDSSPVLGAYIAVADENHVTSVIHAAEVVTDWLDGYYARAGSKILGIDTTERGKIEDPKADKRLVGSVLLGLTVRYARRKELFASSVCGVNAVVDRWRNQKMENSRALALETGVSPGAININKAKMALQSGAELLLTSTAAQKPVIKKLGLTALSMGTAVGVIGQMKFHRMVLAQQNSNALACPYKLAPRNVPDGTIQESSSAAPGDRAG